MLFRGPICFCVWCVFIQWKKGQIWLNLPVRMLGGDACLVVPLRTQAGANWMKMRSQRWWWLPDSVVEEAGNPILSQNPGGKLGDTGAPCRLGPWEQEEQCSCIHFHQRSNQLLRCCSTVAVAVVAAVADKHSFCCWTAPIGCRSCCCCSDWSCSRSSPPTTMKCSWSYCHWRPFGVSPSAPTRCRQRRQGPSPRTPLWSASTFALRWFWTGLRTVPRWGGWTPWWPNRANVQRAAVSIPLGPKALRASPSPCPK